MKLFKEATRSDLFVDVCASDKGSGCPRGRMIQKGEQGLFVRRCLGGL